MIRVIAISSTSTPATSAANSAANAISSRVGPLLALEQRVDAGSFCLIAAAMPA